MAVLRLSRGRCPPARHDRARQVLAEGARTLVPAITALRGLLHHHVGIDAGSGTMINVSVWQDEAAAQQMATLQAVQNQCDRFVALGVEFDPLVNYAPVWDITP